MRRISILALVMLFSVSSVAGSRYYSSRRFRTPVRYRTRYSPYAFGLDSAGLVSGDVRYCPYALGHSSSGLVPEYVRYSPYALGRSGSGLVLDNVRYSPYALGQDSSGLVADAYYPYFYAGCCPYNIVISDGEGFHDYVSADIDRVDCDAWLKSFNSYDQKSQPSCQITFPHKDSQKQTPAPRQPDAKQLICSYLKSKKIDFKMERVFTIEGKTISADFLIRDKNVVIKYWSPVDSKQMSGWPDLYNNMYDKYLRTWDTLLDDYQKAGLIVFQITSSNREEILAELSTLSEING